MIVEREIAGFVLPFTVGIIAQSALSSAFLASSAAPATVSLFLASAPVFLLIHPSHQRWNRHILTLLLLICAVGCGMLTGITHDLRSLSSAHDLSSVTGQLKSLSEPLKSAIGSIPFKNTATNRIITALISGERSGISPETISAFRESGASHILALSGLHLGIIYGVISQFLSLLGRSPRAIRIKALIIIFSCGLYKTKARDLVLASRRLVEVYGGVLPDTMEELLTFPGVGRKIANLLLGDIYKKPAIVADTHCIRISVRLGLVPQTAKTPEKVEKVLSGIIPPAEQSDFCHRIVWFGREYCMARGHNCNTCPMNSLCDKVLD